MKSILAVVPVLLTFLGPARTIFDCEGCSNDNSNWEGTGGNDHIWEYNPAPTDMPGTVNPGHANGSRASSTARSPSGTHPPRP